MENKKFDQLIKKKISAFEATPPASTFSKIQEQLGHTKHNKGAFVLPLPWLKYGIAASLAFLMGMGAMSLLYNNEHSENISAQNQQEILKVMEKDEQLAFENTVKQVNIVEAESNLEKSLDQENIHATNEQSIIKEEKLKFEESFQNSNPNKITIDLEGKYAGNHQVNDDNFQVIKTYALYNFPENVPEALSVVKVEQEPSFTRFMNTKPKSAYAGFWAGPKISFESRYLGGQSFIGNGFGVDFGFNFKGKLGLQSGLSYNMISKEFRVLSNEGKQELDLYNLSAINLPLALKYRKSYFARGIERPVSFNTYLGADYSRLQAISKNQIGAHLGLEYDIFLRPELMFTIGVKAGVNQIMNYKPTESYLSNNAGKKLNYTLGIYTAIRISQNKQ